MVVAHREFVRKHPVATKRALRAILKAADLCAREPERVAQLLVDKAYASRYGAALQTMQEVPYSKWREYDPEDTVRSTPCGSTRPGCSRAVPRSLSPRAPTGGSSTN